MIYYTCVTIGKVEKTGLVYSSIPGIGLKIKQTTNVNEEEMRDEGGLSDEESECMHVRVPPNCLRYPSHEVHSCVIMTIYIQESYNSTFKAEPCRISPK